MMNIPALFLALVGAAITFAGFGLAKKFTSKAVAFLVKLAALAAGFVSLPALQALLGLQDVSAAGAYWAYIMIGAWLITSGLRRSKNGD